MSHKNTTNKDQLKPDQLRDEVYRNMAAICYNKGPTEKDHDGHEWRYCSGTTAYTNGLHIDAQGAWRVDNPALAETMIRTVSDVYHAIGVHENATQYYIPEYIWIGTGINSENWIKGWVKNKQTGSTLPYDCQRMRDVVRKSAMERVYEFNERLGDGKVDLEARCGT